MTQEVLKLALEALERSVATCFDQYAHQQVMSQPDHFINQAITAIKEALREHAMREVQRLGQEIEQEPVVGITAIRTWFKDGRVVTQTLCNSWVDTTPPQQEPVAYWKEHAQGLQRDYDSLLADFQAQLEERNFCPRCGKRTKEIHTCTPPQRTWVGLTDEQRDEICLGDESIARAIEAKLKELNT